MGNFATKYAGLNAAQKKAADRLDGPVMVIAGPGTGKTELLSVRVANILKKTDALGDNILCLTFTESGANSMRERLADLMGKDAYQVAVHTFHGFGSEIISRWGEYFYSGASFRPADELSTHQILTEIFAGLTHNHPLSSRMNGEYSYLKFVQNTISDFKKAGLTPDEVQRLVRHNQGFLEFAEPALADFFDAPMHKSMLDKIDGLYQKLSAYQSLPTGVPGTEPLSDIFLAQLENTIQAAHREGKATGLTAWRNAWLEKNKKNRFVFKDTARHKKLLAASLIYADYLSAMQAAALYDYDDMILRLVHALEVFPELKFNLQEQYQYILVDEFQDTNGAQMRILLSLTDNPVHGRRPNILVVGDDDQAIYSFQGAELSNLLSFEKQFDKPLVVALRQNYRSAPVILERAREVITQGQERLENVLDGVDKTPLPMKKNGGATFEFKEAPSLAHECARLAESVAQRIKAGTEPSDIAVLARSHADIQKVLPYFNHLGVAYSYEHQDDILESPPVMALLELARIVVWLEQGRLDKVDAALPELLSHPAWNCAPQELWRLSLAAYQEHKTWLEIMQQPDDPLGEIAEFLVDAAFSQKKRSLEENIDYLYGLAVPAREDAAFTSPLGEYFFSSDSKEIEKPRELIKNIHSLSLLRQRLRDYQTNPSHTLKDFVDFIDKLQAARIRLRLHSEAGAGENAVSIMTAHKAKGQEFGSVFIFNATDQAWGSKSRGRPNRLGYPANLPIAPPGTSSDERLRLFFVAMTRAKRELVISYSAQNESDKLTPRADFLHIDSWKLIAAPGSPPPAKQREIAEINWRAYAAQPESDLKTALVPVLANYRLSVTHMNSFLDVVRGGPKHFLIHNLLRFPRSLPPPAALGSAVHRTLKQAHDHFAVSKEPRPLEDILYDFETHLGAMRLAKKDFDHQLQKGSDALQAYLAKKYGSFSSDQVGERNFHHQNLVVGGAKLTGIIDVMTVDKATRTVTIGDYKTGQPSHSWNGRSDWEKIKLHHYKQQLLFYKLLIDASPEYRGLSLDKAVLEFIEPDEQGDLASLEISYAGEDVETFKKLVTAVWQKIMAADFPDTAAYPQNYKGILAFENDLLKT